MKNISMKKKASIMTVFKKTHKKGVIKKSF